MVKIRITFIQSAWPYVITRELLDKEELVKVKEALEHTDAVTQHAFEVRGKNVITQDFFLFPLTYQVN